MKDAKEALYCMGKMADKCLTSLSAIQKDYNEFVSLVKRMREAQTIERKWGIVNFKTEEDKVACGEAIRRMYQLESEVDEYLKKMEDHK